MRWSQFITSTLAISTIALTGCFDSSGKKDSPKNPPAMTLGGTGYQQPDSTTPVTGAQKTANSANAKQCYQDLCQGEEDLNAILKAGSRSSADQQAYFGQHIRPYIDKLMGLRYELQTEIQKLVNKEKMNFEKLTLSQQQNRFAKTLIFVVKQENFRKAELKEIHTKLKTLDFQRAVSKVKLDTGASNYFKDLHPNMTVQAAAVLEAKESIQRQNKINDEIGIQFVNISSTGLTRALKGDQLDTSDLASIVDSSYGTRLIDSFLHGEMASTIDSIPRDIQDYQTLIESKDLDRQYTKYQKYEEDDVKNCSDQFYLAINLSPSKEQNAQFEEKIEAVKDATLGLMNRSNPAYPIVEKAIFNLPYSREEIVKVLGNAFKDNVKTYQDNIQRTKTGGTMEAFLAAIILAISSDKKDSLCAKSLDYGLNDEIDPNLGISRLSWLSVTRPEYGVNVVAHELGHVVFHHSNEHSQQMQCLQEKQGTDQYTNEDFADWLSVKVELALQNRFQLQKKNFGCLFASLRIGEGLRNSYKEDTHSSDLYRALQLSLNRQENIPASCENLAKIESPGALTVCR